MSFWCDMKNSCSPTLVPRQVLHIGAKLFVLFVKNKYRDWDLLSSNDVCVKRTNFQEGYIYVGEQHGFQLFQCMYKLERRCWMIM